MKTKSIFKKISECTHHIRQVILMSDGKTIKCNNCSRLVVDIEMWDKLVIHVHEYWKKDRLRFGIDLDKLALK